MAAAFLQIISLFLLIPLSLISMLYGWGIEPKNWWVIALGYVPILFTTFVGVLSAILKYALDK